MVWGSRGRLAPGRHASINSTYCDMMAVVSVVVTVNSGNRIESSAMTPVHILLTIAIYREVTSNDQLNVDWIGDTREVTHQISDLRAETSGQTRDTVNLNLRFTQKNTSFVKGSNVQGNV
jgi:hypothetical protein